MTKHQPKISIVLLIMLLVSSFSVYGIEDFTSQPVYNGLPGGQAHYQNIRFRDIENHWAQEAIQEMAAFSVITGSNNQTFAPNGTLTYLEALTILVRATGGEEAAQQYGELEAPETVQNIVILSSVENWAKGYVQQAIQQGIITNEEANQIMQLTPQQTENLENQVATRMEAYAETGLTEQELAALQAQIQDQLESHAFWDQPVSREEVALWVARILELPPSYGSNITQLYRFTDWQQTDTEKIPYVEAILKEGIMSGVSNNAFSPKGNLTRAQMAQMIYTIHDDLLPLRGLTKIAGTIVNQETVNQQNEDKIIYGIQNDNDSMNYLAVQPQNGVDFVVQDEATLGLSSLLKQNQYIEYYINEAQQVVYARVVPSAVTTIEGTIELVDTENNRLAILDYNNQRHLFNLGSDFPVTVNGKEGVLTDILYGQEVQVTLRQNTVIALDGFLEENPELDGYIVPGTRVKVGDVLFANSQEIEIKIAGIQEKYRIVPETSVTRNGLSSSLSQLKTGDRVILSFDDIYSADIANIRIEDDERHIEGVYRGTLESVNTRTGEMLLNNVTQYQQGSWSRHPDQKVQIKVDGNIYQAGIPLTLAQLDSQKGKEVYAAIEDSYGVIRSAKTVVKEGSTQLFDSSITSLSFGLNRMTVNNNYIYFNEGTIVINNDRLVDRLNLETAQTVHLASDLNNGVRNAALVSIQYDGMLDDRIDSTRLVVYRGKISAIAEYNITLSRLTNQLDYLVLEEDRWVSVRRPKQLVLTDDTYVFDSQLEEEIESGYFINSRFMNPDLIENTQLKSRIKSNYYLGRNAFIIVKESTYNGQTLEEVVSINLTPSLTHTNSFVQTVHSATGQVATIDLDAETLEVGNLRNWNTLNNRWEAAGGNEVISLEKAVILLNDEPVSRDTLYTIRPGAKAYLVKNKSVSTQDDAYVVIIEQ